MSHSNYNIHTNSPNTILMWQKIRQVPMIWWAWNIMDIFTYFSMLQIFSIPTFPCGFKVTIFNFLSSFYIQKKNIFAHFSFLSAWDMKICVVWKCPPLQHKNKNGYNQSGLTKWQKVLLNGKRYRGTQTELCTGSPSRNPGVHGPTSRSCPMVTTNWQ